MWPFAKKVKADRYHEVSANAMILNPNGTVFIARLPFTMKVPDSISYKRGEYEYEFLIKQTKFSVEITLENWLS